MWLSGIQAFLDFHDFRSNAVYNSILFSSPLALLSNLDLRSFRFKNHLWDVLQTELRLINEPSIKTNKQRKVLFWHFRNDFGPFWWEDRPLRFARACNTVVPKQLVLPHSYHFVSREFCEFYPKFDYILDITTTEFSTWSIKSFLKL